MAWLSAFLHGRSTACWPWIVGWGIYRVCGITTGDPAGYVFNDQGSQHVVWRTDLGASVQELCWDANRWHANDLTNATSAPVPWD
jgi:hypothetical protein